MGTSICEQFRALVKLSYHCTEAGYTSAVAGSLAVVKQNQLLSTTYDRNRRYAIIAHALKDHDSVAERPVLRSKTKFSWGLKTDTADDYD
jgi:hypothetical protein